MKCPHCPKEISEEKAFVKTIGKRQYISNPDYDGHVKIHTKKTRTKK